MARISRLGHTGLYVNDLEESRRIVAEAERR